MCNGLVRDLNRDWNHATLYMPFSVIDTKTVILTLQGPIRALAIQEMAIPVSVARDMGDS